MKKIIHVNQHIIRANKKHGKSDPVITVKTYKSNDYAYEVEIKGPSKIVYSPDCPLECGARVWIETHAEVVLIKERNELLDVCKSKQSKSISSSATIHA